MSNRFSDRIGVTSRPKLAHQEVSEDLRVALWNTFDRPLFASHPQIIEWRPRLISVYEFLHWRIHECSYHETTERRRLEKWFFSDELEWYETYNFLEFVARLLAPHTREPDQLYGLFNDVLEGEGSPYRFVERVLTRITDENEIAAVEAALTLSDHFAGARNHLTRAVELLGQRPRPDYRNAIKEAISAVESTLKVLTGHDHADLAAALREYARTHPIHGALFRGLDSLYGYTSSEHGLRHALLETDANVGFAEAKFMVVACSAFVGYLIARSSQ